MYSSRPLTPVSAQNIPESSAYYDDILGVKEYTRNTELVKELNINASYHEQRSKKTNRNYKQEYEYAYSDAMKFEMAKIENSNTPDANIYNEMVAESKRDGKCVYLFLYSANDYFNMWNFQARIQEVLSGGGGGGGPTFRKFWHAKKKGGKKTEGCGGSAEVRFKSTFQTVLFSVRHGFLYNCKPLSTQAHR